LSYSTTVGSLSGSVGRNALNARVFHDKPFDSTKNAQYHQDLAWTALMADVAVRDEMVEFVKMEALLKPGSNEYYDQPQAMS
jgi:hypothetical protein